MLIRPLQDLFLFQLFSPFKNNLFYFLSTDSSGYYVQLFYPGNYKKYPLLFQPTGNNLDS